MSFRQLPIDPTEGFPQAFRLTVGTRDYQFRLYANVAEEKLAGTGLMRLPDDGAFLVLTVDREDPAGLTTILRRKLVPDVVYHAAELALVFRTMLLDRRNLNGIGSFGSQVVGGVAPR